MGWTLPSTGMWRGEVFAISDCLVLNNGLFPGGWQLAILFLGDCWLENVFLGDGDFGAVFPGRYKGGGGG